MLFAWFGIIGIVHPKSYIYVMEGPDFAKDFLSSNFFFAFKFYCTLGGIFKLDYSKQSLLHKAKSGRLNK